MFPSIQTLVSQIFRGFWKTISPVHPSTTWVHKDGQSSKSAWMFSDLSASGLLWMLKSLLTGSFDLEAQHMRESYSMGQTQCFLSVQNQQHVLAPEICLFYIFCHIHPGFCRKGADFLSVVLHKLGKQKLVGRRKWKLCHLHKHLHDNNEEDFNIITSQATPRH